MITITVLSLLFLAWALITATFLFIGFVYACICGTIDLILLSPFIILASPLIIVAAIIVIVVICKKKAAKKKVAAENFDVID